MLSYEDFLTKTGFTEKQLQTLSTNTKDLIPFEKPYPIEIRKSSIHGKGIFTTKSIKPGQTVCSARIKNMRTSGGRYINHSGNPNVFLKQQSSNFYFVALTEIESGSELTANYFENLKLIRRVNMNEEQLIALGNDSENLLKNEGFIRVINLMMDSSVQNWAQSEYEDTTKREQSYSHFKALSDVIATLNQNVTVRDQINDKNDKESTPTEEE